MRPLSYQSITYHVDEAAGTVTAVYEIKTAYWNLPDVYRSSGYSSGLLLIPTSDPTPELITDFAAMPKFPLQVPPQLELLAPRNHSCYDLYQRPDRGVGLDEYVETASRYTILTSTRIMGWLQTEGYQLSRLETAIIENYSRQGKTFMAIEYGVDGPETISGPVIRFDYTGQIDVPLVLNYPLPKVDSVTAEQPSGMEIRHEADIWIVAESIFRVSNYRQATMDWSRLHAPNAVVNPDIGTEVIWNRMEYETSLARSVFFNEQTRILYQSDEPTFMTTYTGRLEDGRYLTHLRGYVHLTDIAPDAVLVPDIEHITELPPVVDLNDYVDPLIYRGCSTRTIRDDENPYFTRPFEMIEPDLPTGYFRPLGSDAFALRYPENWVVSDIDYVSPVEDYEQPVLKTVIAPVPLTSAMFAQIVAGELAIPVFVRVQESEFPPYQGIKSCNTVIAEFLGTDSPLRADHCTAMTWPYAFSIIKAHMAILTTDADWTANEAMYQAMLDYPTTYQYALSPNLRHTLFLNQYGKDVFARASDSSTQVGYPNGWVESTQSNGSIRIAPEEAVADEPPFIHIMPSVRIVGHYPSTFRRQGHLSNIVHHLRQFYTFEVPMVIANLEKSVIGICGLTMDYSIPFTNSDRHGLIMLNNSWLIEVAVPLDATESQLDTMNEIAEQIVYRVGCG